MLKGHVLDFSTNTEMFKGLQNSNFDKIIGEIFLYLRENLKVTNNTILANCVIGVKVLDVSNTERHIYGQ